jgi:hypothetical protein
LKVDWPIDIKPGELRCPHCFGKDIVPSKTRGIWDTFLASLGRIPRHCRSCGRRFHPTQKAIGRDAELRAEKESAQSGRQSNTGF